MNVYAWLSLSASVVCLCLGITVYSFNRKSLLNKLFVLASIATFFYSFTSVMMWQAGSFESASFWNKMGSIWPFSEALVLNFALVFTGNKWLKNKLSYVFLYLPAALFWLIDLFTNLINAPPVMKYWGYNDVAAGTWVYVISTIWAAILPILAFVLCFRYYRSTREEAQKQQRKYVTIGFAIPVVAFVVTNMLFRSVNIEIPNLGIIAILFFGGFVGYGIVKHDLFTFDAAMAAENIVSTMPDSLILADMRGKMLRVNKGLTNFLSYQEHELIGKSLDELSNDRKRCGDVLQELTQKRAIHNYELTWKTRTGEEKNVLFSGSVVRSKMRRDIGIVCVIHDITELKKLEGRLLRVERLASIGELAGMVGHDLRNPLTGIAGATYYLRTKYGSTMEEKGKEMLKIIEKDIEYSNKIINDLLDYSRELHLEFTESEVDSIVKEAIAQIKVPKSIKITNLDHDALSIKVDREKIKRVSVNIIKNAIDAMPNGGTLTIACRQVGSCIEMSFADTGPGISEEILPKIFSPLFTTKAQGMGFGLAICKRIVEAHEGTITVETVEGKGTTFKVILPAEPKAEIMPEKIWVNASELLSSTMTKG